MDEFNQLMTGITNIYLERMGLPPLPSDPSNAAVQRGSPLWNRLIKPLSGARDGVDEWPECEICDATGRINDDTEAWQSEPCYNCGGKGYLDSSLPLSGPCAECGDETEDRHDDEFICDGCNAESVRGQERDKVLDDPRHGQAREINAKFWEMP